MEINGYGPMLNGDAPEEAGDARSMTGEAVGAAEQGARCRHVVVTGGAGYIGSTLVPLLLAAGWRVTVLDKLVHGVQSLLHVASHPRLTVTRADVTDTQRLAAAVEDADAVVHLAAVVGFPACDRNPELATRLNVDATRELANLMRPEQRLVFACTGSCYGAVVGGACTETTPINPVSLYGRTKAAGERAVLDANGVSLRLATVFGVSPRLRLDLLVNALTLRAQRHGELDVYEAHVMRTFLHVSDAARAFLFALDHYDVMKGQAYNVGDERMNMTKGSLAARIQMHVKNCTISKAVGQDADRRDYDVSYEKIRDLGFTSTSTIDAGIRELVRVLPLLSEDEILAAQNI